MTKHGEMYPLYIGEKWKWCIGFNGTKSILYDENNFIVNFESEEEAQKYIDELKEKSNVS